jgi:Cu(I)/Ag(I) efflux system membrane fusion protein
MTARSLNPAQLRAAALVLVVVAAGAGYSVARLSASPPPAAPVAASPAVGRTPLYWYDPMQPLQHFAKPGRSPFMAMDLVPRYADAAVPDGIAEATPGVRVDPSAAQSLGIRVATVRRGTLASGIEAPGIIAFNQRDVAIVQARAAGFVQRTYARAPGDVVRAGAPLADVLVPSWAGAQGEYLAVLRTGDAALAAAARQRLVLLGMPAATVATVTRRGRPQPVVTITTPNAGTIQTLDVRPGMTVAAGQTLAQVAGLDTIWLDVAVPETQAGQVRVGQSARAVLATYPGETFNGRVSAILPTTQADSRTLQVRVALANRAARLRPGMFATVAFTASAKSALLVPAEAVIRTGTRSLVMLAGKDGRYTPVTVQLGREAGDDVEIVAGLSAGQRVVASGQFLLDSEASLSGIAATPIAAPVASSASPPNSSPIYRAFGRIEAITAASVTLSHTAVPALSWPATTMTFKLDRPAQARGLKIGDRVEFAFEQRPDGPTLREITPEAPR